MKIQALALLLLVSIPAQAENMRVYLNQTQTLVQRGQHQKALDRMIWFHENALKQDPSMYSMRLTVALDSWKHLAGFYPPAKTALVAIRDRGETQLVERGGSRLLFQDVVAINLALDKPERSLEAFRKIHQKNPKQARKFWDLVKEQALAEREFEMAKEYLTDVKSEFEEAKKTYERNAKIATRRSGSGEEALRQHQEVFVARTRPLIEMATTNGDPVTAAQIQQSALDLIDEPSLRTFLTDGLPEVPETLPPAEDPPLLDP
jgi:hypothetical protein